MMHERANFRDRFCDGGDGQEAEPPSMAEGDEVGKVITFRRKYRTVDTVNRVS